MGDASKTRSEADARWSDWMARAQQGDREIYQKLVTELASVIEAYLRSRFGNVGASDFVEECVQESLIAIHRARHSYDPRRSFGPWLFTIVRHKAIDLLRRQRSARSSESVELEAAPAEVTAQNEDPSRRLDGATLLERLDPKYREALVLTKLDGYSMEEAAGRAGISVTAMKTRVHRAIRAVRKTLVAEELS